MKFDAIVLEGILINMLFNIHDLASDQLYIVTEKRAANACYLLDFLSFS